MFILIICIVVLVVSYGINIYVEENNKEVTKEFIEVLQTQNEILRNQNKFLKDILKLNRK